MHLLNVWDNQISGFRAVVSLFENLITTQDNFPRSLSHVAFFFSVRQLHQRIPASLCTLHMICVEIKSAQYKF